MFWLRAWMECQTSAEQYPDVLSGLILKESNRTPGSSIILGKWFAPPPPPHLLEIQTFNSDSACGGPSFIRQTRAAIRQSRASEIGFKELEYRPNSGLPQAQSIDRARRSGGQRLPVPRWPTRLTSSFAALQSLSPAHRMVDERPRGRGQWSLHPRTNRCRLFEAERLS